MNYAGLDAATAKAVNATFGRYRTYIQLGKTAQCLVGLTKRKIVVRNCPNRRYVDPTRPGPRTQLLSQRAPCVVMSVAVRSGEHECVSVFVVVELLRVNPSMLLGWLNGVVECVPAAAFSVQ